MKSRLRRRVCVALVSLLLAAPLAPAAHAAGTGAHVEGTLPSGATYVMDTPDSWNGTVLLYSHGYTPAGLPASARNAPDAATESLLLQEGYALIGSSYASNGWAVTDAVPDQLATLDAFTSRFGRAGRTVAWGSSYGGLVTAMIAERHPDRISGSLSLCGLLQGGVANWNNTLDPVFALKTLLAPGADIRLTGLESQAEAVVASDALAAVVAGAQDSASGRARIALAAALQDIPGWNDPSQPRPEPSDHDTQQANQYQALMLQVRLPAFSWRQEAESRVGGNMSWNTGVDYTAMLHRSPLHQEVGELYREAGLSLDRDLAVLNRAPRIAADPRAVEAMARTSSFTGRPAKPQLTVHTTGDGLIPVPAESAYRRAVTASGSASLLRQAYVGNAGHCTFSSAEQVAALHALEARLTTGRWQRTDPAALNSLAEQADSSVPARYVDHRPAAFPRPYDLAHPGDRYRP
ncbi:pimeloyl-ACP methyl ester carboxylesterase [Streptomyces sp. 3330]|uniref:alpha/beta hydrolase family protein n=1 Tax=Streptomyces sp. 3330 TaxID=2817755 RepID=UPI00285A4311|nr:prolyl oligopeptidase family serine peptidase [Streptomyces sp. 3330]MDR6975335.1 pimeloyl-ACP methyl ester carboxylesterase [Streptomyces sp. 3330]